MLFFLFQTERRNEELGNAKHTGNIKRQEDPARMDKAMASAIEAAAKVLSGSSSETKASSSKSQSTTSAPK